MKQDLGRTVFGGYSFCRRTGFWSILCPVIVTPDGVYPLHPRGPYGINTHWISSSYDHDSFYHVLVERAIQDVGLSDTSVYLLMVTEYDEGAVSEELRQQLNVGTAPKQVWTVVNPVVYPVRGGWTVIDIQPQDNMAAVPEGHRNRILEVAQDNDFWRKLNRQIDEPKRLDGVDEDAYRESVRAECEKLSKHTTHIILQLPVTDLVHELPAFDDTDDDCPF